MENKKRLFAFVLMVLLSLSACYQQSNETPANPKINSEYNRTADIEGIIVKVDEDKAQLSIKGSGFGLNEEGKGIIQLDTEYYATENFEEEQKVEIWVGSQAQVSEELNLPIIRDVAKINFTPKKEE